jgi:hypothetical protein
MWLWDFDLTWEVLVEIVDFRDARLPGYELGNREMELGWQLQNNGKEEIRFWKEDLMRDLSYSETVINPLPGYD